MTVAFKMMPLDGVMNLTGFRAADRPSLGRADNDDTLWKPCDLHVTRIGT